MSRLRIDRLDLDLRGVDPLIASAAVRDLGPALKRALGGRRPTGGFEGEVDAGGVPPAADGTTLAASLAARIAGRTTRG